MTKHICVGYDGSASSSAAVTWAGDEASLHGTPLEIVCCYTMPALSTAAIGWITTELIDALMHDASDHATAAQQATIERHPDLDVTTRVMMAPASAELMIGRGPDDLIVVGASGHRGAGAFWMGSTPRDLVRHSPCPVAVVRGGAGTLGTPTRVVVGTDGSPASDLAIEWAIDEAARHHVELIIVHAWSYPYMEATYGSSTTRELMEVDAACILNRAVDKARLQIGADVHGELVEDGSVPGLLSAVRDGDLLVVGSHGRGAIAAGLLGSTVNAVLDQAVVPVVVVRQSTPR